MKERPIPFNGTMVRAILDGSKTQTRRVSKLHQTGARRYVNPDGTPRTDMSCPYGHPGDRLWVREAWRAAGMWDSTPPRDLNPAAELVYEADGATSTGREQFLTMGKYRPPMFMPRWASRITLEIASVRVERLQDISEDDCRAEGCHGGHGSIPGYAYNATPIEHFQYIWKSTGGNWDANPWVWVPEFRRVDA